MTTIEPTARNAALPITARAVPIRFEPEPLDASEAANAVDGPELTGHDSGAFAPEVIGRPVALTLAALLAGSGAIHFAMAPAHAAASTLEAIAFVATAWVQLGLAALLVWRPAKWILAATVVTNVVFIAVWAISRRYGLPIGAHPGQPESAGFVDLTCGGLEAAAALGATWAILSPGRGHRIPRSVLVMASIIPLGALVLASVAIASPGASEHGHAGGPDDHAAGDHAHSASASLNGPQDALAAAQQGGTEMKNGHSDGHDPAAGDPVMDAATATALYEQLDLIKPLIAKYPTIAAAEADGYRRNGPFAPGVGTHYSGPKTATNSDGVMDAEDIARPILIFDGTSSDSKLAGFMYLSVRIGSAPEGFAGPGDHWHFHTDVCLTRQPDGAIDSPFGADTSVSKELCDSVGGELMANTGYMVHVWVVPGYESPRGVFSDLNPRLTCPDGSYDMVPYEELGHRVNGCKSA